ncbi:uncharacterized protein LOC120267681 [Dioscorea cayenensis subsp. rotundata]|uniref:Uncharacterized protein LOC120267681 n=1 Tax=Dioscorea cayennensis subsp. rotundata TaxID=55577 RepID=A0AB40BW02_DIOCR|nr:uncharacterized protein LOC120267681 [Dioscorea cayenensis subsp. rotundata]
MGRKAFLRQAEEQVPDDLRCRRSDGRSWRCPRRAVSGVSFCEHHYGQAQRHAAQRAAPAEPKEKRGVSALVAVDHPPEKRRKRGGAMDELVRVAVRRQVKRSEERRKRGKTSKEAKGKEVVINLPNGVMAISPTPLKGLGNADPPLDQKLGLGFNGADFSSQRRFRSKNLEPVPIQSISRFPSIKGSGKRLKRVCHRCRESKVGRLVMCSSCKKESFCTGCIKEWYSGLSEIEVKVTCPVCRGECSCEACSPCGTKEIVVKETENGKGKDSEIQYAQYLISQLLPVLKRVSQEKKIELGIEASRQGRKIFSVQLQMTDSSRNELINCYFCKRGIADIHRCCSSCSYILCLSCCQEIPKGSLSGVVPVSTCSAQPGRGKTSAAAGRKVANGVKQRLPSGLNHGGSFQSASPVSNEWQAKNSDDSIPCPPKKLGGCNNGSLILRYVSVGPTTSN